MSKKLFQRYLPDPSKVQNAPSLKFLGRRLLDPNLWHLNRRSTALAFFIGVFFALIPLPFQMVFVAVCAVFVRANLPVSVALVWITNPVTMPIIWFSTYKLGCFLLNTPVSPYPFRMSVEWLRSEIERVWMPLYMGSLIAGLIFATVSYFAVRIIWRWNVIRQWRRRSGKRGATRHHP